MATQGRFITLEGGEGVGKSTLARALDQRLRERGLDVVLTREPGGTPGADHLRNTALLTHHNDFAWPPLAEALLFYAARVDHLDKVIRPALARGAWVICDRFSDSTRAYQAVAHEDEALLDKIDALDTLCIGGSYPDLTLVLDLPVSASSARRDARADSRDVIEARGADYHQRVREAFLAIAHANYQRCVVIDAAQPASAVADASLAAIDSRGWAR